MLRLSSAALARAIGYVVQSRYPLKQQQRFLADIKNPQPRTTPTKPGVAKPPGNLPGSKAAPPIVGPQPVKRPANPATSTSVPPTPPTVSPQPVKRPANPATSTSVSPTPPTVSPQPVKRPANPATSTSVSPTPPTVSPQPVQRPTNPATSTSVSPTPPTRAAPPPPPPPPASPTTAASDSVPPPVDKAPVDKAPVDKAPKKKHRFRNFVITLTLLTGLTFGGGVFYSLKSDNFHDFFTEYIPFGEEAVLYFEEREFRRRFPHALSRFNPTKEELQKVTIPRSSGATWKVHDPEEGKSKTTDVGKQGPHISAKETKEKEKEQTELTTASSEGLAEQKPAEAKVIGEKQTPVNKDSAKVEAVFKPGKPKTVETKATAAISPVEIGDVNDPVVQDLVNVVNSIISLVNRSGAARSFETAISSAKLELSNLNNQIAAIKGDLEKATEKKLKHKDLEFATAAQGLLTKVNNEVVDLEHKWKDEFEQEREKIIQSYRERLAKELERSHKIAEQRLRNELLEQAIEMKRKFIGEIEERVENERNGRLGRLQELTDSVDELRKLSTSWSAIIATNLKTQQMHVALEAVRAAYESPEQPKPFLRELAALKEVADDDEVVCAAIASINPRAYQEGVSTQTQLVDRFRRVAEEVRKAALLPENAGFAGHAASWVLSKVLFRKQGLAQGTDVESILTRTETFLEEGDVDSAAREMNQLTGWSRTLARDWLKEARLLLEVQQAVDVIAAEARLQSLRVQGQY